MLATTTKIATWGNSDAIRIPRSLLAATGLRAGDQVELTTTPRGGIEINRLVPTQPHRHVRPKNHVTFEDLFAEYDGGRLDNVDAWPQDEMTPTERRSWSD